MRDWWVVLYVLFSVSAIFGLLMMHDYATK